MVKPTKIIPQRLKPAWFYRLMAQLKLCPFKAGEFFPQAVKPDPPFQAPRRGLIQ
jgi:hypothetical protein